MARKTNYSYEKRQKELAKIEKKKEKRLRKLDKNAHGDSETRQLTEEEPAEE